MINFLIFEEGLLMPLLDLGVFVVHKRSKRKKIKNYAPPTHQLLSYMKEKGFNVIQGMALLL